MRRFYGHAAVAVVFAAVFVAFYRLNLQYPIISDDYRVYYYDFRRVIYEYFHWSGRLVPIVAGALLTKIPSKALLAAANSLMLATLLYNIAALARVVRRELTQIQLAALFVLVFVLFWLANPSLGGAVFWTDGSANYLWPACIAIGFLRLALLWTAAARPLTPARAGVLLVLGLLTGASSEVLSLSVVVGLGLAVLVRRRAGAPALLQAGAPALLQAGAPASLRAGAPAGRALLLALAASLAGTLVLYGAPGNYARFAQSRNAPHGMAAFAQGMALRVLRYFLVTFNDTLLLNTYVFLCFIGVFVLWSLGWRRAAPDDSRAPLAMFPAMFVFASLFAMIAPAVLPNRALETQLILLLCCLVLCMALLPGRALLAAVAVPVALFAPSVGLSYYLLDRNFASLAGQQAIIERYLAAQRAAGQTVVAVPYFFDRRLAKAADKTELFIADDMAKYFGVTRIVPYFVDFDFSVIDQPCKDVTVLPGDDAPTAGPGGICVREYDDPRPTQQTFVIELAGAASTGGGTIEVHVVTDRAQTGDYDFMLNGAHLQRNPPPPYPAFELARADVAGRQFYYFTTSYLADGVRLRAIEVMRTAGGTGLPV